MPAPAHVNAKLDPFRLGLRYLGLILLLDLGLFQFAAGVRATTRQFALQRLVNSRGLSTLGISRNFAPPMASISQPAPLKTLG
jgi:hypothetical protein